MTMPWMILDRDGVINEDADDYIKSPDEWRPIPGSIEAIARLSVAGVNIVIATNQSGIGRGYFSVETLDSIHRKMREAVEKRGGIISGIFYCPHRPDDHCQCRKPNTGLLDEIERQFAITLRGTPFVGDSERDLQAAQAKGCLPILVRSGKGLATCRAMKTRYEYRHVPIYDDLEAYVDNLLN